MLPLCFWDDINWYSNAFLFFLGIRSVSPSLFFGPLGGSSGHGAGLLANLGSVFQHQRGDFAVQVWNYLSGKRVMEELLPCPQVWTA